MLRVVRAPTRVNGPGDWYENSHFADYFDLLIRLRVARPAAMALLT